MKTIYIIAEIINGKISILSDNLTDHAIQFNDKRWACEYASHTCWFPYQILSVDLEK